MSQNFSQDNLDNIDIVSNFLKLFFLSPLLHPSPFTWFSFLLSCISLCRLIEIPDFLYWETVGFLPYWASLFSFSLFCLDLVLHSIKNLAKSVFFISLFICYLQFFIWGCPAQNGQKRLAQEENVFVSNFLQVKT